YKCIKLFGSIFAIGSSEFITSATLHSVVVSDCNVLSGANLRRNEPRTRVLLRLNERRACIAFRIIIGRFASILEISAHCSKNS
ncbi:unnamed protein product, partial [Brugia timori]|uniref:Secreted protein n=1 Tax=Brugia timori TaxID=42155 RepID=A0A0R3QXM4_9BILA